MAAPARKEPAPASASDRLTTTQVALEETNRKIGELDAQRNECLLADNNEGAIKVGIELAGLKLAAGAHADKIQLLRSLVEKEAAERRGQERERVIEGIEDKLAARAAVGRELADSVAAAERAFRKLIDIGNEIQNSWSWPPSDIAAILLSPVAISHALSAELYRIGGRPRMGGGQVEPHGIHAGVDFPGAKVPRFELTHLPEKIPAFTSALAEATAFASAVMRGKRPGVQVDVAVPVPAMNGNAVQLTPAQGALGKLLKRQAAMVEDPSTSDEDYKRLIDQIAQAQAVVSAEQQGAHQNG
jgi:hypothetical protein